MLEDKLEKLRATNYSCYSVFELAHLINEKVGLNDTIYYMLSCRGGKYTHKVAVEIKKDKWAIFHIEWQRGFISNDTTLGIVDIKGTYTEAKIKSMGFDNLKSLEVKDKNE